jgi:hypothetical protein
MINDHETIKFSDSPLRLKKYLLVVQTIQWSHKKKIFSEITKRTTITQDMSSAVKH